MAKLPPKLDEELGHLLEYAYQDDFERDYPTIAADYANRVVKKQIPACKWTILAAKRFLNNLKRDDWDYVFVPWYACDACAFIEALPHVEGAWDSENIELTEMWTFIIVNVFGWRKRECSR